MNIHYVINAIMHVSFTYYFFYKNQCNQNVQEVTTYFTIAMIKSKLFCLSGRCGASQIQIQNVPSLATAGSISLFKSTQVI